MAFAMIAVETAVQQIVLEQALSYAQVMFDQADRIHETMDQVYGPTPAPARAANGQFQPGNQEACGNPFARRVAQLRSILMQTATDGDFAEIAQMLIAKAKKGDLAATRLLLSYTLGKPSPTVNPDRVAIDEWEVHQDKAVSSEEMEGLFAKVSVKEANCMANIAWPCSIYDNITQQFLSDEQKKTGMGAGRVKPSTTEEIRVAPPSPTGDNRSGPSNGQHRAESSSAKKKSRNGRNGAAHRAA